MENQYVLNYDKHDLNCDLKLLKIAIYLTNT